MKIGVVMVMAVGMITPAMSFAQTESMPQLLVRHTSCWVNTGTITGPALSCLDALVAELQQQVTSLSARVAKLEAGNVPNPIPIPQPTPNPLPPTCDSTGGGCTSPMSQGTSGASVETIQKLLKAEGLFTYPTATGYYGSITEKAVKAYQEKNGLPASGIVDQATIKKMEMTATRVAPSLRSQIQNMTGGMRSVPAR